MHGVSYEGWRTCKYFYPKQLFFVFMIEPWREKSISLNCAPLEYKLGQGRCLFLGMGVNVAMFT